jgi:thioester reductase-like protein
LSAPLLGFTSEFYAELVEKVDVIIHVSGHPRGARTLRLIAIRRHGPYTSPVLWSPLRAVSRVSLTCCPDRAVNKAFLCKLGTRNLLDMLAAASPGSRLYFCSSLASVLARPPPDGRILEAPSLDPSTASPIGYSQSKWVTEAICRSASESARLRGRVHVLRIGQLCGDTMTGHWNEKEGWPLLIRTGQTTGCLPLLNDVRHRFTCIPKSGWR